MNPDRSLVSVSGLAAAAYLSALSFLFGNVQPVILGAMADNYGISLVKVGALASVFMLVSGAVKITAPAWIRRISIRFVSIFGVAFAAVAIALIAMADDYSGVLAGIVAFAVAEGLFGSTSYTVLGDFSRPARAYAIAISSQMTLAALFILFATWLIAPKFGYAGMMFTFALTIATGLLVCRWVPVQSLQLSSRSSSQLNSQPNPQPNPQPNSQPDNGSEKSAGAWSAKTLLPLALSILATVIFLAAIMALWVFSERYAASFGLGLAYVGTSVAVASAATALAALISATLSERFSPILLAAVGVGIVIFGVVLLTQKTSTSFILGMSLLSFGWGTAQPFFYGAIRLTDPTGKLFSAAPAMINLGIAGGIALGGLIADQFGFSSLIVTAVGALLASVGLLYLGTWAR